MLLTVAFGEPNFPGMTRLLPTRPRCLTAATAATALTLGLAACGAGDTTGSDDDRTVGLTTAFGRADFPVTPERAVVTASALDNVLALGITPTAVIMTAQDEDAPWREGRLDNVDRITVATYGDIDAEKIAAEDPDVIIGDIYWIDSQDEYDRLSAIAPTLNGPSQDPTRATWKERLTQLGELYDRPDAARQVIDDDTARFRTAQQDMPGLAGKTGWIGRDQGDGSIGTSPDPTEASNTFLYDLGMTLPPTIEGKTPNGASGAYVASPENLDEFAADFSVLYTDRKADTLAAEPTFAALPQVKKGTMLTDSYAVVIGLAQPSSLVRAWALDELRPTLEKVAAPGD